MGGGADCSIKVGPLPVLSQDRAWMCLDVLGCAWMCLDVLGCAWMCLDVLGCAWMCFSIERALMYDSADSRINPQSPHRAFTPHIPFYFASLQVNMLQLAVQYSR
jgi:hypothetical protein